MANITFSGGESFKINSQYIDSQSRTVLTNIQTSGDAWGKNIPVTWGQARVGGAIIWASPFYKTITKTNIITEFYTPFRQFSNSPGSDTQTTLESYVSNTEQTLVFIDIAYSLGFEGDPRANRTLRKVRINDTIVYDSSTDYLDPDISFDIRKGTDPEINLVMAKYPDTGKYFYPGQTYIIFQQFPLAKFGNSVPTSVDCEFAIDAADDTTVTTNYPTTDTDLYSQKFFVNHSQDRVYFYRPEIGSGVLAVYSIRTGTRYPDIVLGGGAAQFKTEGGPYNLTGNQICVSELANVALCSTGAVDNFWMVNLTTGVCTKLAAAINSYGFCVLYENAVNPEFLGVKFFNDADGNNAFFKMTVVGDAVFTANIVGTAFNNEAHPNFSSDGSGKFWYAKQTDTELYYIDTKTTGAAGSITVRSCNAFVCVAGDVVALVNDGPHKFIERYDSAANQVYSRPADYDITNFDPAVNQTGGGTYGQSDYKSGVLGQRTAHRVYAIDLRNGAIKEYVDEAPGGLFWDSISRSIFFGYSTGGEASMGLYTYGQNVAFFDLFSFLQSLYAYTGAYTYAQITEDGITDKIRGAILAGVYIVDSLVSDICTLYRLEKVANTDGVFFYRSRNLAGALDISATLDVGDLVKTSGDNESSAIQTTRKNADNVVSEITLKFIDVDNDFKANSVNWRRQAAVPGSNTTKTITLPFVMSVKDAMQLVQLALSDDVSKAVTHTFTLPPKYNYLTSGDIIQITNGKFLETIRITEDTFNGDFTVSCLGESVATQTRIVPAVPELPDRDVSGLGKAVGSVSYQFDTPTLTIHDEPADGRFIEYLSVAPAKAGSWLGGYLARRVANDEWSTLMHVYGPDYLVAYSTDDVLTNKRWVTDSDTLELDWISGAWPVSKNKTKAEIDASDVLNLAFYGAPDRWEIIQFEAIIAGVMRGIVRGLRGTEINCGLHQPGDFIVLNGAGMAAELRIATMVGQQQQYKAVTENQLFSQAVASALKPIVGRSLYPYAPSGVRAVLDSGSGDTALSWFRRDRKGKGWGAALPLTEEGEAYTVAVLAPGGAVLRTLAATGPAVTYTAAMAAADGLTGASALSLRVAQVGALGPGFSEAQNVHVE